MTAPAPVVDAPEAAAPALPDTTAPVRALRSAAPPRPRLLVLLAATAAIALALLLLAGTGAVVRHPVLIPPLAASAALIAGAPALPLAQPRSVIGGHLLAACVGFLVVAVAGPGVWSAVAAGALAFGATSLARTPHSPAVATSVIVGFQAPDPLPFLGLLAAATVILSTVGFCLHRLASRKYPAYWW
ncbi:HPP family protein [Streptomyces olivaceiscleroticus]|uniref:HPP transmembrane region domain-containing protein n=1 Tax=Streptomyces olivaceiscleroticus TaxID=68245 RepID=A0ABN1ATP8_9ACTN